MICPLRPERGARPPRGPRWYIRLKLVRRFIRWRMDKRYGMKRALSFDTEFCTIWLCDLRDIPGFQEFGLHDWW